MEKYIITYTKAKVNPFTLKPDEIRIEDIAHALSMVCVNKHLPMFYSLAEFNLLCCLEAKARNYPVKLQMLCLLHNAHEAYLPDPDTLVESDIEAYIEINNRLKQVILDKYMYEAVSEADIEAVLDIKDYCYSKVNSIPSDRPSVNDKANSLTEIITTVQNKYLQLFNRLVKAKDYINKEDYLSVGIDGCEGKWITVAISNTDYSIDIIRSIDEVCRRYANADSILIDMPIGLPETANEAELRPDSELRKVLKGKASSVFNVPCRQAIYETDKAKIREENIKALGKSLAEQSIAIIPKIREIDHFLQQNEPWKNRLRESHPEVCFAVLNHGVPIYEKKKEPEGIEKRIAMLEEYYPETRDVVRKYKALGHRSKNLNDLLDALCLAIVGRMGNGHEQSSIPEHPVADRRGLLMQVIIPVI